MGMQYYIPLLFFPHSSSNEIGISVYVLLSRWILFEGSDLCVSLCWCETSFRAFFGGSPFLLRVPHMGSAIDILSNSFKNLDKKKRSLNIQCPLYNWIWSWVFNFKRMFWGLKKKKRMWLFCQHLWMEAACHSYLLLY